MAEIGFMQGVVYFLLFAALYFQVFMLVSFLRSRRDVLHEIPAMDPSTLPKVAIIVPCFNEEKTVASTIESLQALAYPHEKLEIIVVDDGSKDRTYEIALAYASDARVKVFHKENGGKHTAMNYALERTDAELIGCLDADSVVAPEALLRVAYAFRNPTVAAVTPGIHVKKPGTLLQHLQKTEYRLSIFMRNAFAGLGAIFITPGPFSIFRAAKVRELGGWKHAHSTEDLEMGLRMQEHGLVILNDPQASVYTSSPKTLKALIRQRVRWTYGFLRNAIDYKHMVGNPRYGNLGLFVLPTAVISIITALFFFGLMIWEGIRLAVNTAQRIAITGLPSLPSSIDLFYVNTSISWLFVYCAIALILVLISIGSYLSTGSRRLPMGTPLFLMLYGFIVPLWLATAVTRAIFKTGVRWR